MHALLKVCFAQLFLLTLLGQAAHAAPSSTAPPASAATPDYGGRDSAMPAVGTSAPDPAASAGRALEALVVVLAGVGGVVYVLKRFNLVKSSADGKSARITGSVFGRTARDQNSAVTVVSSQSLPGGAMLHVVRVGEKNLLLAATAQSVTSITEWDAPDSEAATLAGEFEEYLTRADPNLSDSASGIAAANARLRSLLSQQPEEPS